MTFHIKQFCYSILLMATLFAINAVRAYATNATPLIRIDGELTDAAWKHAQPIQNFTTAKGQQPQAQTSGFILTDSNMLYLAFRCEEPLMDKLELSPLPRDGNPWINDCMEIFIAPFHQREKYFHIVVDAKGQIYDALVRDKNYDLTITTKVQKQQNSWTLEMAIPLADLGLSQGQDALMNFCRERKPVLEDTCWHGGFHQPQTWQTIPLNIAPQHNLSIHDWSFENPIPKYGQNNLTIQFTFTKSAPVKVLLYEQKNSAWKLINEKSVSDEEEETIHVSLPYSLLPQRKPQALRCEITRDNNILFRSVYQLDLPAALTASLSLPYYYADENWGRLQIASFVTDASLKSGSIRLTIQDPNGKIISTEKLHPLQSTMHHNFDISGWRTGVGEITTELLLSNTLLGKQTFKIIKERGPFTNNSKSYR